MEPHAEPYGRALPGHHGPAAGDGTPASILRRVLSELQRDARDVFACSGETVDRFLRDRRDEARRQFSVPA